MTRTFFAAAVACAALLICLPSARAAVCDPIGAGHCLLPFPNDHFTKQDPREWNRADGFGPGQQITVRIPGQGTPARRPRTRRRRSGRIRTSSRAGRKRRGR